MENVVLTEERLREAVLKAHDIWLSTIEADEEKYVLSPAFERKIKHLIQRMKLRRIAGKVARTAAGILLTILVGAAAWLTFDVEARAAVKAWFMEFYEHNIVYRFCENAESDEFPLYELGYIPDGFELEREVVTESFRKMKYKNSKTGEGVVFEYRYYTGFLNVNLWEPSGGMKSEKVYINDTISDYYSGNEKMDNNILVLVSNKMVFIITSNMEKTEIIKIAEQISEINK
ncbi:MAG: DUF4367 domain-containing protein [Ruminococcaceae bacterium]|nr:DUF4367 domain-containing protein [Oscillospiraceae bacterium]